MEYITFNEAQIYPEEIREEEEALKDVKKEIRRLYNEYKTKQAEYDLRSTQLWKKQKRIIFSKKICASCKYELSEENIKYEQIYCDECCSNDSCLAYSAYLSD